jgi:Fe-S-cluster-containing hydrogenase component 2/CRP-like cAMP-binding protein
MAKQVMPAAELERRATDVKLTDEQFLRISLFAQLKTKPNLEKYPGTIMLRRFRKGEVVFRQGEAGWTAFYILTSEDLCAIEGKEKAKEPDIFTTIGPEEAREIIKRLRQLQQAPAARDEELRTVATVNLAIARPSRKKKQGPWQRLQKRLFDGGPREAEKPLYIPSDGPRDLDYQTLQSHLYEGELFGEMSCLYRTPRSATVVATRDCYMLEMLRNIIDQLQKDKAYKEKADEIYKKRVFQLHLRQLSIFRDLTQSQFDSLASRVDLVTKEPGELIFDEHERSDSVYLVRSGLVRVVKKVSALLHAESVRHWKELTVALLEGEKQPSTPRGKIWQLLAEPARILLRGTAAGAALTEEDQQQLLYALNDVIKDRVFADAKEFQPTLATPEFVARATDFPAGKRKDWPDQELRRFNRLLLETILPNIIRQYRPRVGPENVLSYLSRGEFMGEMGVLGGQPRSASCFAYGHPQDGGKGKEAGRVELVRILENVVHELVEANPRIRERINREIASRLKINQKKLGRAIWDDDAREVMTSKRFEELGLIQGQRLMLIDLDRCTRCDECVKACVNTHEDGRSRLFLDGPRFDKYLVPVTCRSCLDPVCMIGCPVGSIHRGNNGEIEIEDWCIGCGLCANNCPYGSIQMYDIGLLPFASRGWRFLPAGAVKQEKWFDPGHSADHWPIGEAPFHFDRFFRDQLEAHGHNKESAEVNRAVYFRTGLQLPAYLAQAESEFKLEIASSDAAGATIWVNGTELQGEKAKSGKREFLLPPKSPEGSKPEPIFRPGRNVIAARVTPPANNAGLLFDLRLDAVSKPGAGAGTEVTEKLVTERAVVCDLCSSSFGQVPACVNACPHDAAMRVDARFEFPVR